MAKKVTKPKAVKAKVVKTRTPKIPEIVIPEPITAETPLETVIPETVILRVPPVVTPLKPTLATASTADLTKPAKKIKAPKIDILRGRMPLVMVFSIKFLEDGSSSEIAAKYRTTMGKVDDIKKESNFGYVKDTFKPTEEMIKAAIPRCKELPAGKEILTAISKIGIATPEDEIAFAAIKAAMRKKTPKVNTGEPASDALSIDASLTNTPPVETVPTDVPLTDASSADALVTDTDIQELTDDDADADLMSLLS
jgi:hypothetical protein